MVKVFLDLHSLMAAAAAEFHYFDFAKLARALRARCGAELFYLAGDYGTRLTKLVVADLQEHVLGRQGVETDLYDPDGTRGGCSAMFAAEVFRDFRMQAAPDADTYIVVTADAAVLPTLAEMQAAGGDVRLLADRALMARVAGLPCVKDIDVTAHGRTLRDKLCIGELARALHWTEERMVLPTRMFLIRRLERYSHISRDRTSFFLNCLVGQGILSDEKQLGDDRVFFAIRVKDAAALEALAA